jgi:alkylation response protein AidB-like acyl-CoA dehydrogenase
MTTLLDKQRSATGNVQNPDDATLDQMLLRIAALAPMVARLAPDIEQGRRLPAELVSALKSARIYGMLVPRRYGGLELDAPSAFRAIAALARLDGSVPGRKVEQTIKTARSPTENWGSRAYREGRGCPAGCRPARGE